MTDFQRGRVRANGIEFEFLEAGNGPLALCMHGFPDTPFTYRHLLPALADAGFRAVAPRSPPSSAALRRPSCRPCATTCTRA